MGGCEARGSTQYIPHKKYELFYSEHTVYFPDPLCCARSMAELFFLIQKLSLWESFWSYIFIYGSYFTSYFVTFGLHMLRGMLLRADRRRMYS